MARKLISLKSRFRFYNKRYFDNKLKVSDVRFGQTIPAGSGETTFFDGCAPVITIDRGLKRFVRLSMIVLLHEMAHVGLHYDVGHGPEFKKRIKRLVRQGAYDDLL